ncbi:hypothetical protein CLAFUW4_14802 [Fulvia fulva]|uniref:UBX domain-containing protein n=1 Tax=Passalora fulva TaxID=5499 RepID=A0A9Q8PMM7_PASFU|nr:uncharacterized protein CLAFUR5_14627 [Fulvia fulva]KAK4608827.1 hypothetical protein CLAFUR4_14798 [Fulvia fulva]KAK4609541.1 hypothetical protein CLAFUR0_14794 [Fulvia fulva]UJO25231.1 hypothetical protein CLAFUR5_14627 [Fulvia fulva]WPV22561.1 hypothetical protein CLAFUW4_14802 [Fulvia fulva]WPV37457.1 hypothetical protein CLAFUW7_14803 [Fulvia fulva]
MFHEGDLQSGISLAITEGKFVACFIRQNDNEESRTWEEEWLGQGRRTSSREHETMQNMSDVFSTRAVILRIELGSQEAGFLSAFCPIDQAPTFIVIHNGQVLEKVGSGVSKEDFVRRVSAALGIEVSVQRRSDFHDMREEQGGRSREEINDQADMRSRMEAPQTREATTEVTGAVDDDEFVSQQLSHEAATSSTSATVDPADRETRASSTATPQAGESANMSELFGPDRAKRHEEEKAKQEAAEKAKRKAIADRRRKEAEEAHAAHRGDKGKGKASDVSGKEKARRDWLVQQKQRKDEAQQEKARILAGIEAAKQERKARSQRPPPEDAPSSSLAPSADAASRRRMGPGGMCNLLIRLFDGTSIKGRFEPNANLATAVRDWIKQQATGAQAGGEGGTAAEGNVPFTFKQIMAPQPSRSIEMSEEFQSLADLGLVPNATLVLIPVQGYTDAYSSAGGRGYMSTALHAAYGVANTATSIVSSALSYVPGFGGAAPASEVPASSSPSIATASGESSSSGSIKVKTLADQRAEAAKKQDPQTFYNGNSSAFEGRKDDDDKK